jgi:hypothetical protein
MVREGIITTEQASRDPAASVVDGSPGAEESQPRYGSQSSDRATGNSALSRVAPLYYWHWLVVASMAFLFGVFVWPTPFEYRLQGESTFLRISRFSGKVEGFSGRGWIQVGRKGAPAPAKQIVPTHGTYDDLLAEADSIEAVLKAKALVSPKK